MGTSRKSELPRHTRDYDHILGEVSKLYLVIINKINIILLTAILLGENCYNTYNNITINYTLGENNKRGRRFIITTGGTTPTSGESFLHEEKGLVLFDSSGTHDSRNRGWNSYARDHK